MYIESPKDVSKNVHGSSSYNTPSWKSPKCPSAVERIIKLWLNVLTIEFHSTEDKETTATQAAMGESRKHNVEQKEADPEEYVLYDSIYIKHRRADSPMLKDVTLPGEGGSD